jgi:hypothetical protein
MFQDILEILHNNLVWIQQINSIDLSKLLIIKKILLMYKKLLNKNLFKLIIWNKYHFLSLIQLINKLNKIKVHYYLPNKIQFQITYIMKVFNHYHNLLT